MFKKIKFVYMQTALWVSRNKLVGFMGIFTAVYLGSYPFRRPKMELSSERAELIQAARQSIKNQ